MANEQERSEPRRARATANRPGKNPNRTQPGHHRSPATHPDRPTGRPGDLRRGSWPVGAWALVATAVRAVVDVVELVIDRT